MKNKHPHAVVVLVLGLAMAGLHLADLLLWSEADTGFTAAGSVWLRYIPWLAARRCGARLRGWRRLRCPTCPRGGQRRSLPVCRIPTSRWASAWR